MSDADVPDVASRAQGPGGVDHRFTRPDCLDDRVHPESVGHVLDPGDGLVAALLDDVRGAELLVLTVYTARPGSASEERLRLLGSSAATEEGTAASVDTVDADRQDI